jgi:hypothetical protein
VVATGALDSDHHVSELVAGDRLAERDQGLVERSAMVLNHSRWAEDTAVEVGEHPLRAGLGAVHGDDTEVLGTDSLNSGGKNTVGLTNVAALAGAVASTTTANSSTHEWVLR